MPTTTESRRGQGPADGVPEVAVDGELHGQDRPGRERDQKRN